MTSRMRVLGAVLLSGLLLSGLARAEGMLADRHVAKGLECKTCHVESPSEVDQMTCQGCHGDMDAMGEKSEGKFEVNPHAPHGAKVSCLRCHHGHKEGENYCNKCHEFNFHVR